VLEEKLAVYKTINVQDENLIKRKQKLKNQKK